MPDKRKASMSAPSPKRARVEYDGSASHSYRATTHEKPRNDPLYGQKNAFPGLDGFDEQISYDDTDDGLQYLRMVRSEANALPSLLTVSSKKSQPDVFLEIHEKKIQSCSLPPGFHDDEACIAPADQHSAAEPIYPEAQAHYHNLLRHRFLLLRSTLKCSPPATAIANLDDSHPISLPPRLEPARKEWRRLVLSVDPQMVQIACMDLESVLAVLQIMARVISDVIRSENAAQIRRISAWAWGLLGKCRELGELGTEEVGGIRDIGKRAVTISMRMREAAERQAKSNSVDKDGMEWDEISEEDLGSTHGPELEETRIQPEEDAMDEHGSHMPDDMSAAELEAAKAKLQARFLTVDSDGPAEDDDDPVKNHTQALLDMIITVVGEFFGQRDLLEAREIWTN